MKKFLCLSLAGLLAAGLMTGCKDDVLPTSQDQVLEEDTSFFVNITVNSASLQSRAGVLGDYGDAGYDPTDEPNFDNSSNLEYENYINNIWLIFYDKDGNRVCTSQVRKDGNDTQFPNTSGSDLPASDNAIYSGIVQVDVKHGSQAPAYVMAFINPITPTNFESNRDFETLASLEMVTRPEIINDKSDYFAMSKSVYYGTDPVTKEENTRIMAAPILDDQLFNSEDDAKNNSAQAVDIYVERYAAKVNFSMKGASNNKLEIENGKVELVFVPEYWAVNCYETETYVTKSFFKYDSSLDGMSGVIADFQYLDDNLNSKTSSSEASVRWLWNSEMNHRSYWGQSPGYYKPNYPRGADDLLDSDSYNGNTNRNGGYALNYYSYNNLKTMAAENKRATRARCLIEGQESAYDMIYVRENTISGAALKAAYADPMSSPKAAIGSIVLVGHYKVNGKELEDDNQIFFMSGNSTNGYTYFANENDMMDHFLVTGVRFSKDFTGNEFFNYKEGTFKDGETDYRKYFEITHPDISVRKNGNEDVTVIDRRYVTVQIKKDMIEKDAAAVSNGTGSFKLYALIGNTYTPVTPDNLVEINRQLMFTSGMSQGFRGGKAYFSIPIQHLGYYRNDNPNYKNKLTANSKNFDWTAVRSGDFGIVRNHVYNINVTGITGLGNAISDPNDPLVPPTDPEDYYIGAKIVVLNWAVVPTQNVIL